MFRDDAQLARCCRALMAQARMEKLWTVAGPTPHALELLDANGGPLSSGERIMLLVTFAFWNGRGELRFAEIVETLDVEPTGAVCLLLTAVKRGADQVDAWLDTYGVPPELTVH
jgi:hypothetical protein